ncbi:MAG: PD-(D/E)XK nuclease family protein [Verrucomicrobiota bacterium]
MILIERQAPSHWYLRDGRPFHEIGKKDGSGNRAVNVADARKVLALPSVTNVLGVLAKPGLEAWKIEQGILAALTLPRRPDESLDAFAHRVVIDMGEQVEKASNFGTAIHNACEVYAVNKETTTDEKLLPFLTAWRKWFDENVERIDCVEQVFVNLEHGYAGRVDMLAKLKNIGWAVVDFKTQKIKRNAKGEPKPMFYEVWPLQLAAYQKAVAASTAKNITALVSVVIDSIEPGPVHVRVWDTMELKTRSLIRQGGVVDFYFRQFLVAAESWKYIKDYDPNGEIQNLSTEKEIPQCERPALN